MVSQLKLGTEVKMATPKKIILLACGSFNPPTHMHLRIFEIARDYLHRMGKYQVVAGLMSPVHDSYGKKDLASSSDRCEMVRRSLQNSDWIHLSDWECHQTAWTPTRQVLHHHQELVDSIVNGNVDQRDGVQQRARTGTEELRWADALGNSGEQLHMKLLCGGDLLESFGKPGLWKDEDIEAIVGSYGLIVITREGSNPLKFIYESDVLTRLQRNIELVTEWIANEVSSSRIRRALGRCESVKYLLPDPVIGYVHQRGLYGASSEYVRPLSLQLLGPPGLPPSFLTPSPCDVDMTYCERPPPTLTLTAPDSGVTERGRSQMARQTAPPPAAPTRTHHQSPSREENARCRTWRQRAGGKKPGSSRRVRPESTGKVRAGDSGTPGRDGCRERATHDCTRTRASGTDRGPTVGDRDTGDSGDISQSGDTGCDPQLPARSGAGDTDTGGSERPPPADTGGATSGGVESVEHRREDASAGPPPSVPETAERHNGCSPPPVLCPDQEGPGSVCTDAAPEETAGHCRLPAPVRETPEDERVRIELRLDGVIVVSRWETRL